MEAVSSPLTATCRATAMARPRALPICWALLNSPEETPCSLSATPAVTAEATLTMRNATPSPVSRRRPGAPRPGGRRRRGAEGRAAAAADGGARPAQAGRPQAALHDWPGGATVGQSHEHGGAGQHEDGAG